MDSNAINTEQLSMPLGEDLFWADLANEEDRRSADATQEQWTLETKFELIPVEEWRQRQSSQLDASLNDVLAEWQLYAVDGGIFKAKQQDGRWQLWVWHGHNGNDVGTRTGFEVDAQGLLYDRVFEPTEEAVLVVTPARFSVTDLRSMIEIDHPEVCRAAEKEEGPQCTTTRQA